MSLKEVEKTGKIKKKSGKNESRKSMRKREVYFQKSDHSKSLRFGPNKLPFR
jgi:hypothetical protein